LIISLCVARSRFVWLSDAIPNFISKYPARTAQAPTPQIAHNVLCLAEVHFLQQIAHLELHVFHHPSDVGDVRRVVFHRHVGLDLAHHVAREVQGAERLAVSAEGKDDGRCELVMGGARAVLRVKDVDAVPAARARRGRGNS
jgi:hypothetical protein